MNTIFKNRFFVAASLFAMLFAGLSCEDNIGVQPTPEAPNADKTLYEVIVNDKDLTDFVEVLDACNLPSSKNPNEKVSVADSLFNTSRVYTVWAPVNGTFNKDSIINRVKDGYREDVMKTFVGSHVANFLKPAKGEFDKDGELILMLNDKKLLFAGSYKDDNEYTFNGNKLQSVNNRVLNGIIHKLGKVNEYKYNIWEYIKQYADDASSMHKIDSLVNYLYSYNDTTFSEWLSTPGPIVNGAETFLDSVFIYENSLLTKYGGVGNLDNEDSLYTFYVPTNDAWNKIIAQAEKHFNYNKKLITDIDTALVDSLRLHYTRSNVIKYLTYSDYEQKYLHAADSIMPAQNEYKRKYFARADVERSVVETKELSNGTLKIVDEYPYSIFDLWHDTIRIEAENTYYVDSKTTTMTMLKTYAVADKDINKDAGEKLSASQYIVFGDDANSKTELEYYIPNVKSASYRIALITVPRNITNKKLDVTLFNPVQLRCVIKDARTGDIKKFIETEDIFPKPDAIDTIYLDQYWKQKKDEPKLGTPVTFSACEYGGVVSKPEKYTTKIQIIGDGTKKNFDRTIRLDAILLIPVEDPEEENDAE